jgi:hypothetical protein
MLTYADVGWRMQVNIRENNGGCDCKVRGIFLKGHFLPTGRPSGDQWTVLSFLQVLLT